METPSLKHLSLSDYEYVYEPAEDTFLMMDALEKDLGCISSSCPRVIVEICCGTGVIISALSRALHDSAFYIAADINQYACEASNNTIQLNGTHTFQVIRSDLLTCLKTGVVDILICNPPYVPTSNEELNCKDPLTCSWAGGENGRQVMDRLFSDVRRLLSPGGKFYILVLKENRPSEIIDLFLNKGFKYDTILSRKSGRESLSVIKFTKL
ncbi:methyltransferase N6AMT1 [Ischnura elegans]|uniref:methyltransferase N6AMT1 n=1 Tax=Ischnura elegans TaxID=197161 RepID=UPI001ED88D85|nr:methyltransferase N6AMT1 [Ischnura elegans]